MTLLSIMPSSTFLLQALWKLKLTEHIRITYNTFELYFNKQSHYGQPVTQVSFHSVLRDCISVPTKNLNLFNDFNRILYDYLFLRVEALWCSETSVSIEQSTWQDFPTWREYYEYVKELTQDKTPNWQSLILLYRVQILAETDYSDWCFSCFL